MKTFNESGHLNTHLSGSKASGSNFNDTAFEKIKLIREAVVGVSENLSYSSSEDVVLRAQESLSSTINSLGFSVPDGAVRLFPVKDSRSADRDGFIKVEIEELQCLSPIGMTSIVELQDGDSCFVAERLPDNGDRAIVINNGSLALTGAQVCLFIDSPARETSIFNYYAGIDGEKVDEFSSFPGSAAPRIEEGGFAKFAMTSSSEGKSKDRLDFKYSGLEDALLKIDNFYSDEIIKSKMIVDSIASAEGLFYTDVEKGGPVLTELSSGQDDERRKVSVRLLRPNINDEEVYLSFSKLALASWQYQNIDLGGNCSQPKMSREDVASGWIDEINGYPGDVVCIMSELPNFLRTKEFATRLLEETTVKDLSQYMDIFDAWAHIIPAILSAGLSELKKEVGTSLNKIKSAFNGAKR